MKRLYDFTDTVAGSGQASNLHMSAQSTLGAQWPFSEIMNTIWTNRDQMRRFFVTLTEPATDTFGDYWPNGSDRKSQALISL